MHTDYSARDGTGEDDEDDEVANSCRSPFPKHLPQSGVAKSSSFPVQVCKRALAPAAVNFQLHHAILHVGCQSVRSGAGPWMQTGGLREWSFPSKLGGPIFATSNSFFFSFLCQPLVLLPRICSTDGLPRKATGWANGPRASSKESSMGVVTSCSVRFARDAFA